MPRRPILLALAIAVVTTGAILLLVRAAQPGTPADARAAVGQPAPAIKGTTLDGAAFDLAAFARQAGRRQLLGPELRALPRRVPAARGQAGRARRRTA